jgi:hypothetical protein
MEIFLVDVHSFSDLITNSSTDVFAFKTNKSVEAIEELLRNLLKAGSEKDIDSVCTVSESTIRNFWDQYVEWIDSSRFCFHDFIKRFHNYHTNKTADADDKVVVVKGVDDNSIPYWLSEYMRHELGTYSIHLG